MHRQDPERRCLSLDEWPVVDQCAWSALLEEGDILSDRGAGADWAPNTREVMRQSYGNWLNWLRRTHPTVWSLPPGKRTQPYLVSGYVTHLRTIVASQTVLTRVRCLLQLVSWFAPDQDWAWLDGVVRRLRSVVVPVRRKRDRLLSSQELYAGGMALLEEAAAAALFPDWRHAQRFQDGLMLALLASRPLRLGNLSAIEIGRHLRRSDAGFQLRFEDEETKTRVEIETGVPEPLVPWIDRHLATYRPLLRQRAEHPVPTDRLWIGRQGEALQQKAMYYRITRVTERTFGVRINPHCFRDCAATSIALAAPEQVRITLQVLGHASLRTSERHYNHANATEAARRYQKHVQELRRQSEGLRGQSGREARRKHRPG